MIDHIGITTASYPTSKAFYTAALAPLNASLQMAFTPSPTHSVSGWGRSADAPTFWLSSCPKGTIPTSVHVAFSCPNRAMVDAFYEAAIAAGGTDNGKPGVREQYHPNYYGAFVKDLDGHGIEAVCHLPPGEGEGKA